MFAQIGNLLAPPSAPPGSRVSFEWGRLQSFAHWGHWLLLAAACLGVLCFVFYMYRRDSVELKPWVGWFLLVLRLGTFAGLLLIYLQPQWRTDQDKVINSRVVVLADTSLSMGLAEDAQGPSSGSSPSRADQTAGALGQGGLIEKLRAVHDVAVLRFDQDLGRVAMLPKLAAEDEKEKTTNPASTGQLKPGEMPPEAKIDWPTAIKPRGNETRLGQALRQVVNDERTAPISGIVVFTDGGQNAGVDVRVAIAAAKEAKIPIFPVGLGSDRQPVNVRVSDLLAPARAYPGDAYTVTGYVQAQGLAGQSAVVELFSKPAPEGGAQANAEAGEVEASEDVTLGADGEVVPVKFEITPDETGRRVLTLRVRAPQNDGNATDNEFGPVDIEVVDRKTRVLLFSGGPSKEYTFLRNMLQRDKDVVVDVLLQTAQPGISQDANEILDVFPKTREELYEYDCLVALDPDWQELSAEQVDLVEKWVADQAGGMIVVPGPINTESWAQSGAMSKIRALYPVEFHKRFSRLEDSRFGSKEPWPIDFSREGLDAEFLWLADSASQSQQAWTGFEGVYGYYAERGPKPGAVVYASLSQLGAAGDLRPVYMAGQFFGSGRVFYLGSGELWRLRKLEEAYFEQFYTKLIRHVSQGRLLRGSNRGVLLVERDRYLLGNMVVVRAQLNNGQLEPLEAPSVNLEVVTPAGQLQTVPLAAVAGTMGTFGGQFNVYQEGAYRLELPVPETSDERLVRRILVKVPDLERENPRRNDPLLSELAQSTGGEYFIGVQSALGLKDGKSLAERLPDRRKTITVTATPQTLWDNQWVMFAICGILCLEWLIRRVCKLA